MSNRFKYIISILLFPFISFSQTNFEKLEPKTKGLLLQMGAGFLNVARQNQIDQDSGLILAANRLHLSRMFVAGADWQDILYDPVNVWLGKEDIAVAKKLSQAGSGVKRRELLTFIGSFYTFQTGHHPGDNDSALSYLTRAKRESEIAHDTLILCQSLIRFGKFYMEKGDTTSGKASFEQAFRLAQANGLKKEQATALFYWAAYSPFQMNTIADRIGRLKTAASLFEHLGKKENEILALTDLGYLTFAIGQLADAKNFFQRALEIEKMIGFPFTHYTTDLLYLIANVEGNLGSAFQYVLAGIKSFEATSDSLIYGYLCNAMSIAMAIDHGKKEESIDWDRRSIAEFERIGDMASVVLSAGNVCAYYMRTNRSREAATLIEHLIDRAPSLDPAQKQMTYIILAESYAALNNTAKAESYLSKAIELQAVVSTLSGNINLSEKYFRIGLVYGKIRQLKPSRFYLERSLAIPGQLILDYRQQAEQQLARIDSTEGNFKAAYLHAMNSVDLVWTLSNRNQISENQNLRVQYETEKKDNNIKLLHQQSVIQQVQVKQAQFARNVMFGGAALLLLILGLLYNQYRLKQKTNKQLEAQQKLISQKNITLENLVEEKEFLLKEIHHRVKNNLQIVISLLNTQSKFLDNEDAIAAISESKHRMQAMSLIHQKLYQSENVSFVGMQDYIRELVDYLRDSFGSDRKFEFNLDIDPINMDISQAIPIGLILNEAITNCIKHAFESQIKGIVTVQMKALSENMIYLGIADNGKGISPDQDVLFSQSMGMRLIRGLVEQIGGKLSMSNQNGFSLSTSFRKDRVLSPVAP